MQIEKSLNRKMRACYLGPLIIVSQNKGDTYIICELDGTVFHRPIAAFRVIPYFTHKSIPMPDNFLDIKTKKLHELEETVDVDGDLEELPEMADDEQDGLDETVLA